MVHRVMVCGLALCEDQNMDYQVLDLMLHLDGYVCFVDAHYCLGPGCFSYW